MAFTSADLVSINTAIMELAMGQRVTKITFTDGQTVEYGPAGLDGLKMLKADIQKDINATTGTRPFVRTVSSKGL